MNDNFQECYVAAIHAVRDAAPRPLHPRAQFEAQDRGYDVDVSLPALIEYLGGASPNDVLRYQLHLALAQWDAAPEDSAWVESTMPGKHERRQQIYERLDLPDEAREAFDGFFPVHVDGNVIISDIFEPWYDLDRRATPSLYWPSYRDHLAESWSPEAIAGLDSVTTEVISRLSDPLRVEAYQSKGLVVGYVQSGKTANFSGVIAKAMDAGYRLIILMTGTVNILRQQTQRRLDMEVVGTENIRRMVDADDPEVDYADDPAWIEGRFISHGFLPSTQNLPDVIRLTTRRFDYKRLRQGITALELERVDGTKPLYAKENLYRCATRLVIVKKNATILGNLVRDLGHIQDRVKDIPTLIIDDESDLASINTMAPKMKTADKNRTTINRHISGLLHTLPRAQYVGYTATPFANVFIDPSDSEDIFPKDFLLSLERPIAYMGISDFHDLDSGIERQDRTIENSNEKRHIRDLTKDDDDPESVHELREAIDAFVLSGAVKLYREAQGFDPRAFNHHTMLVHCSPYTKDHRELSELIKEVWATGAYLSPTGTKRLRRLYEEDFRPVARVLESRLGLPIPNTYDDVAPYVGGAIARMTPSRPDPVIVVNSDRDIDQEQLDFDEHAVWRILVGGAKLSRGFTVEGLTISYYRRSMAQADSLMQAGRWFGFRHGYRDLVRLYIGRNEPFGKGRTDLYLDFEAILKVEEDFREELRRYEGSINGKPLVTPAEVAPLVHQYVPWLKPTAPTKMYNAKLTVRRSPGTPREPVAYPDDAPSIRHNYEQMVPLLQAASTAAVLAIPPDIPGGVSFSAFIGEADHETLLQSIRGLKWEDGDYFQADVASLEELVEQNVSGWIIIAPQLKGGMRRDFPGVGPRTIASRVRRRGVNFGAVSDPKHRAAALRLADARESYGDPVIEGLRRQRLGAIVLYPLVEEDLVPPVSDDEINVSKLTIGFTLVAPNDLDDGNRKPYVSFTVANQALANRPIVNIPS
jgi:hypothetical protein